MTIDQAIEELNRMKEIGSDCGIFITVVGAEDLEHNLSEKEFELYSRFTDKCKKEFHARMADATQEYFEEEGVFGKCLRSALRDDDCNLNESLAIPEEEFVFDVK